MPNEHPPIPPNNERFVTIDGVDYFMVELEAEPDDDGIQLSMPVEIDKLRGYGKRDCANAARVAWLDEAERLKTKATIIIRDDTYRYYAKHADTNADAWAAWLKGEYHD